MIVNDGLLFVDVSRGKDDVRGYGDGFSDLDGL